MAKKPQTDPAIDEALREEATALRKQVLEFRVPGLAPDALHAVIMDWPVTNGISTVLAAADGTASIYLSNGGGFLGGSESVPAIKAAALHAVRLAGRDHGDARATAETPLPTSSKVFFYFVYESGLLLTRATEATLRDGSNHLVHLGTAMQQIVTEYRLWYQQRRSS